MFILLNLNCLTDLRKGLFLFFFSLELNTQSKKTFSLVTLIFLLVPVISFLNKIFSLLNAVIWNTWYGNERTSSDKWDVDWDWPTTNLRWNSALWRKVAQMKRHAAIYLRPLTVQDERNPTKLIIRNSIPAYLTRNIKGCSSSPASPRKRGQAFAADSAAYPECLGRVPGARLSLKFLQYLQV